MFYKINTGTSIAAVLIEEGIRFGAVIAVYIVSALLAAVGLVTTTRTGGTGRLGDAFAAAFGHTTYILSLISGLGLMPLTMGFQNWFRRSIYEKTPLSEIFAFYTGGRLLGSVGTQLLMSLYTFLWTLLFIVPGIIKTYSYSQTIFIKAENPDIPASRAIELSQIMMVGHKWDLCVFQFTFLGWMLLSAVTYNILGIVYVFPYYYAALAFAYEEIKMDAASRGLIDLAEISPRTQF